MQEKENAYCILNGDLLNNATKTSVSDSYAEEIPPMEQINKAVELFSPIKDKILAILTGNHESRTYQKRRVLTSWKIVARQMGLYDKFSKTGALIFVRFGEQSRGHKGNKGNGQG